MAVEAARLGPRLEGDEGELKLHDDGGEWHLGSEDTHTNTSARSLAWKARMSAGAGRAARMRSVTRTPFSERPDLGSSDARRRDSASSRMPRRGEGAGAAAGVESGATWRVGDVTGSAALMRAGGKRGRGRRA